MAVLDDFGLRVEERVQKMGKNKAEGGEEICREQGSSATQLVNLPETLYENRVTNEQNP